MPPKPSTRRSRKKVDGGTTPTPSPDESESSSAKRQCVSRGAGATDMSVGSKSGSDESVVGLSGVVGKADGASGSSATGVVGSGGAVLGASLSPKAASVGKVGNDFLKPLPVDKVVVSSDIFSSCDETERTAVRQSRRRRRLHLPLSRCMMPSRLCWLVW